MFFLYALPILKYFSSIFWFSSSIINYYFCILDFSLFDFSSYKRIIFHWSLHVCCWICYLQTYWTYIANYFLMYHLLTLLSLYYSLFIVIYLLIISNVTFQHIFRPRTPNEQTWTMNVWWRITNEACRTSNEEYCISNILMTTFYRLMALLLVSRHWKTEWSLAVHGPDRQEPHKGYPKTKKALVLSRGELLDTKKKYK